MGSMCKPMSPEVIKRACLEVEKQRLKRIENFNNKYLMKGKKPPLYETIRDEYGTTRIYPDGRLEFTPRHKIYFLK